MIVRPTACKACGTITRRPAGYCENCEFMTPSDVRKKLHISVSTYFRWIDEGKIRQIELGQRKFLVNRVQIDNLLSGKESK